MTPSHEPDRQKLARMLADANAESDRLRAALNRIANEWAWSPIIADSPNAHTANQIICQMQAIAQEAISSEVTP